ncbi:hypothetical protein D3C78_1461830 [compost metagenome]
MNIGQVAVRHRVAAGICSDAVQLRVSVLRKGLCQAGRVQTLDKRGLMFTGGFQAFLIQGRHHIQLSGHKMPGVGLPIDQAFLVRTGGPHRTLLRPEKYHCAAVMPVRIFFLRKSC